MLGTKIQKTYIEDTESGRSYYEYDTKLYFKCVEWCNEHNATIEDKGEYYEVVEIPAPSLEEVKATKIAELKNKRDTLEVEPILYNGNYFDFDEKARDRINSAIIALEMQGETATISWTTADNTEAIVTANDLRSVIASVAVRSNELHIHYRTKRELVDNATTKEEVEAIEW